MEPDFTRDYHMTKPIPRIKYKGNVWYCQLCLKDRVRLTRHHLDPEFKKIWGQSCSEKVIMCWDCHEFLHKTFTNHELSIRLDTLDKMWADEKVIKYLESRL